MEYIKNLSAKDKLWGKFEDFCNRVPNDMVSREEMFDELIEYGFQEGLIERE